MFNFLKLRITKGTAFKGPNSKQAAFGYSWFDWIPKFRYDTITMPEQTYHTITGFWLCFWLSVSDEGTQDTSGA